MEDDCCFEDDLDIDVENNTNDSEDEVIDLESGHHLGGTFDHLKNGDGKLASRKRDNQILCVDSSSIPELLTANLNPRVIIPRIDSLIPLMDGTIKIIKKRYKYFGEVRFDYRTGKIFKKRSYTLSGKYRKFVKKNSTVNRNKYTNCKAKMLTGKNGTEFDDIKFKLNTDCIKYQLNKDVVKYKLNNDKVSELRKAFTTETLKVKNSKSNYMKNALKVAIRRKVCSLKENTGKCKNKKPFFSLIPSVNQTFKNQIPYRPTLKDIVTFVRQLKKENAFHNRYIAPRTKSLVRNDSKCQLKLDLFLGRAVTKSSTQSEDKVNKELTPQIMMGSESMVSQHNEGWASKNTVRMKCDDGQEELIKPTTGLLSWGVDNYFTFLGKSDSSNSSSCSREHENADSKCLTETCGQIEFEVKSFQRDDSEDSTKTKISSSQQTRKSWQFKDDVNSAVRDQEQSCALSDHSASLGDKKHDSQNQNGLAVSESGEDDSVQYELSGNKPSNMDHTNHIEGISYSDFLEQLNNSDHNLTETNKNSIDTTKTNPEELIESQKLSPSANSVPFDNKEVMSYSEFMTQLCEKETNENSDTTFSEKVHNANDQVIMSEAVNKAWCTTSPIKMVDHAMFNARCDSSTNTVNKYNLGLGSKYIPISKRKHGDGSESGCDDYSSTDSKALSSVFAELINVQKLGVTEEFQLPLSFELLKDIQSNIQTDNPQFELNRSALEQTLVENLHPLEVVDTNSNKYSKDTNSPVTSKESSSVESSPLVVLTSPSHSPSDVENAHKTQRKIDQSLKSKAKIDRFVNSIFQPSKSGNSGSIFKQKTLFSFFQKN